MFFASGISTSIIIPSRTSEVLVITPVMLGEIPSGMGTEQNFDHSDQASELLHGRSWYLTENTALAICYRGERQTHMEQLVQVSLHDMLYSGEC